MRVPEVKRQTPRSRPERTNFAVGLAAFAKTLLSLPGAAHAALLVGGLLVVAWTVGDYGVGWDEGVHSRYGELTLEYFSSGGRNTACNDYRDLKIYGPLADSLAACLYQGFPDWKFTVRHACSAILALLTLPALYLMGRLCGDPWIGVLAGLCLVLLPRFCGHAFINLKDTPFACLFAWSMYALARLFAGRAFRWPEVIGAAIAVGLATAVRPGGWALFGLFVPAIMVFAGWTRPDLGRTESRTRILLKLSVLFGLAWALMVLPWPWAHENPLLHPLLAIRGAAAFHAVLPVLFEGENLPSTGLPWYYLVKYLGITTPPAVLAVAAVGVFAGLRAQCREPASAKALLIFVLQLWFFAPLAAWTLLRPNIYDGLRHFLFLLPALAMWFGLGGWYLIARFPRSGRPLAAALLLLVTVSPAVDLVRLHPYQMSYFNAFAGGVGGADGRYETDYWATSYREAMQWIGRHSRGSAKRLTRVLVAANEYSRTCAARFRPKGTTITTTFPDEPVGGAVPEPFDYYLGTYRTGKHRSFPDSPIVKTIGRDGAVFAVIRAGAEAMTGPNRTQDASDRALPQAAFETREMLGRP